MRSRSLRSTLCLAVLCSAPAIVPAFSSPAFAAAKKAKPAARKKAAPSSSDKKSSDKASQTPAAKQAWEAPPRGELTETPPPAPVPETKPAPALVPATLTEAKPAPAPAPAPAPPAPVETKPSPMPAPPPEEASPAPLASESSAASPDELPDFSSPKPSRYVERLGPDAYPGLHRGLYGGSLWLEPSFQGLQWPYMPRTGVGLSGLAWVDSGYQEIDREGKSTPSTNRYFQQGRLVVRITPTYASGRFFIQTQAEVVANGCQSTGTSTCDQQGQGTVDTDDLWVRVGQWNVWDLKVGRFEGWELYHLGMGLDQYTLERRGAQVEGTPGNTLDTPDFYGLDYLRYRPRGFGLGYVAAHGYFTNYLRGELLGELGTDNDSGNGYSVLGARPLVIFDLGWLKLKAGVEYEKRARGTPFNTNTATTLDATNEPAYKERTRKGYGVAVQIVLDPWVEFGANLAQGSQDQTADSGSRDDAASFTRTSIGGFANFRLAKSSFLKDVIVGAGVNWTTNYDEHRANGDSNPDYTAHLQGFVAVQYLLANQLFIKAVVAYARADFQPTDSANNPDTVFSNVMWSGRVRLMYMF